MEKVASLIGGNEFKMADPRTLVKWRRNINSRLLLGYLSYLFVVFARATSVANATRSADSQKVDRVPW